MNMRVEVPAIVISALNTQTQVSNTGSSILILIVFFLQKMQS